MTKFVRWDSEIQKAVDRVAELYGPTEGARKIGIHYRLFYDYRKGITRNNYSGVLRPRQYVSLHLVERLAELLGDPQLEDRVALTAQEMMLYENRRRRGKRDV
jgi:hypothetical protein